MPDQAEQKRINQQTLNDFSKEFDQYLNTSQITSKQKKIFTEALQNRTVIETFCTTNPYYIKDLPNLVSKIIGDDNEAKLSEKKKVAKVAKSLWQIPESLWQIPERIKKFVDPDPNKRLALELRVAFADIENLGKKAWHYQDNQWAFKDDQIENKFKQFYEQHTKPFYGQSYPGQIKKALVNVKNKFRWEEYSQPEILKKTYSNWFSKAMKDGNTITKSYHPITREKELGLRKNDTKLLAKQLYDPRTQYREKTSVNPSDAFAKLMANELSNELFAGEEYKGKSPNLNDTEINRNLLKKAVRGLNNKGSAKARFKIGLYLAAKNALEEQDVDISTLDPEHRKIIFQNTKALLKNPSIGLKARLQGVDKHFHKSNLYDDKLKQLVSKSVKSAYEDVDKSDISHKINDAQIIQRHWNRFTQFVKKNDIQITENKEDLAKIRKQFADSIMELVDYNTDQIKDINQKKLLSNPKIFDGVTDKLFQNWLEHNNQEYYLRGNRIKELKAKQLVLPTEFNEELSEYKISKETISDFARLEQLKNPAIYAEKGKQVEKINIKRVTHDKGKDKVIRLNNIRNAFNNDPSSQSMRTEIKHKDGTLLYTIDLDKNQNGDITPGNLRIKDFDKFISSFGIKDLDTVKLLDQADENEQATIIDQMFNDNNKDDNILEIKLSESEKPIIFKKSDILKQHCKTYNRGLQGIVEVLGGKDKMTPEETEQLKQILSRDKNDNGVYFNKKFFAVNPKDGQRYDSFTINEIVQKGWLDHLKGKDLQGYVNGLHSLGLRNKASSNDPDIGNNIINDIAVGLYRKDRDTQLEKANSVASEQRKNYLANNLIRVLENHDVVKKYAKLQDLKEHINSLDNKELTDVTQKLAAELSAKPAVKLMELVENNAENYSRKAVSSHCRHNIKRLEERISNIDKSGSPFKDILKQKLYEDIAILKDIGETTNLSGLRRKLADVTKFASRDYSKIYGISDEAKDKSSAPGQFYQLAQQLDNASILAQSNQKEQERTEQINATDEIFKEALFKRDTKVTISNADVIDSITECRGLIKDLNKKEINDEIKDLAEEYNNAVNNVLYFYTENRDTGSAFLSYDDQDFIKNLDIIQNSELTQQIRALSNPETNKLTKQIEENNHKVLQLIFDKRNQDLFEKSMADVNYDRQLEQMKGNELDHTTSRAVYNYFESNNNQKVNAEQLRNQISKDELVGKIFLASLKNQDNKNIFNAKELKGKNIVDLLSDKKVQEIIQASEDPSIKKDLENKYNKAVKKAQTITHSILTQQLTKNKEEKAKLNIQQEIKKIVSDNKSLNEYKHLLFDPNQTDEQSRSKYMLNKIKLNQSALDTIDTVLTEEKCLDISDIMPSLHQQTQKILSGPSNQWDIKDNDSLKSQITKKLNSINDKPDKTFGTLLDKIDTDKENHTKVLEILTNQGISQQHLDDEHSVYAQYNGDLSSNTLLKKEKAISKNIKNNIAVKNECVALYTAENDIAVLEDVAKENEKNEFKLRDLQNDIPKLRRNADKINKNDPLTFVKDIKPNKTRGRGADDEKIVTNTMRDFFDKDILSDEEIKDFAEKLVNADGDDYTIVENTEAFKKISEKKDNDKTIFELAKENAQKKVDDANKKVEELKENTNKIDIDSLESASYQDIFEVVSRYQNKTRTAEQSDEDIIKSTQDKVKEITENKRYFDEFIEELKTGYDIKNIKSNVNNNLVSLKKKNKNKDDIDTIAQAVANKETVSFDDIVYSLEAEKELISRKLSKYGISINENNTLSCQIDDSIDNKKLMVGKFLTDIVNLSDKMSDDKEQNKTIIKEYQDKYSDYFQELDSDFTDDKVHSINATINKFITKGAIQYLQEPDIKTISTMFADNNTSQKEDIKLVTECIDALKAQDRNKTQLNNLNAPLKQTPETTAKIDDAIKDQIEEKIASAHQDHMSNLKIVEEQHKQNIMFKADGANTIQKRHASVTFNLDLGDGEQVHRMQHIVDKITADDLSVQDRDLIRNSLQNLQDAETIPRNQDIIKELVKLEGISREYSQYQKAYDDLNISERVKKNIETKFGNRNNAIAGLKKEKYDTYHQHNFAPKVDPNFLADSRINITKAKDEFEEHKNTVPPLSRDNQQLKSDPPDYKKPGKPSPDIDNKAIPRNTFDTSASAPKQQSNTGNIQQPNTSNVATNTDGVAGPQPTTKSKPNRKGGIDNDKQTKDRFKSANYAQSDTKSGALVDTTKENSSARELKDGDHGQEYIEDREGFGLTDKGFSLEYADSATYPGDSGKLKAGSDLQYDDLDQEDLHNYLNDNPYALDSFFSSLDDEDLGSNPALVDKLEFPADSGKEPNQIYEASEHSASVEGLKDSAKLKAGSDLQYDTDSDSLVELTKKKLSARNRKPDDLDKVDIGDYVKFNDPRSNPALVDKLEFPADLGKEPNQIYEASEHSASVEGLKDSAKLKTGSDLQYDADSLDKIPANRKQINFEDLGPNPVFADEIKFTDDADDNQKVSGKPRKYTDNLADKNKNYGNKRSDLTTNPNTRKQNSLSNNKQDKVTTNTSPKIEGSNTLNSTAEKSTQPNSGNQKKKQEPKKNKIQNKKVSQFLDSKTNNNVILMTRKQLTTPDTAKLNALKNNIKEKTERIDFILKHKNDSLPDLMKGYSQLKTDLIKLKNNQQLGISIVDSNNNTLHLSNFIEDRDKYYNELIKHSKPSNNISTRYYTYEQDQNKDNALRQSFSNVLQNLSDEKDSLDNSQDIEHKIKDIHANALLVISTKKTDDKDIRQSLTACKEKQKHNIKELEKTINKGTGNRIVDQQIKEYLTKISEANIFSKNPDKMKLEHADFTDRIAILDHCLHRPALKESSVTNQFDKIKNALSVLHSHCSVGSNLPNIINQITDAILKYDGEIDINTLVSEIIRNNETELKQLAEQFFPNEKDVNQQMQSMANILAEITSIVSPEDASSINNPDKILNNWTLAVQEQLQDIVNSDINSDKPYIQHAIKENSTEILDSFDQMQKIQERKTIDSLQDLDSQDIKNNMAQNANYISQKHNDNIRSALNEITTSTNELRENNSKLSDIKTEHAEKQAERLTKTLQDHKLETSTKLFARSISESMLQSTPEEVQQLSRAIYSTKDQKKLTSILEEFAGKNPNQDIEDYNTTILVPFTSKLIQIKENLRQTKQELENDYLSKEEMAQRLALYEDYERPKDQYKKEMVSLVSKIETEELNNLKQNLGIDGTQKDNTQLKKAFQEILKDSPLPEEYNVKGLLSFTEDLIQRKEDLEQIMLDATPKERNYFAQRNEYQEIKERVQQAKKNFKENMNPTNMQEQAIANYIAEASPKEFANLKKDISEAEDKEFLNIIHKITEPIRVESPTSEHYNHLRFFTQSLINDRRDIEHQSKMVSVIDNATPNELDIIKGDLSSNNEYELQTCFQAQIDGIKTLGLPEKINDIVKYTQDIISETQSLEKETKPALDKQTQDIDNLKENMTTNIQQMLIRTQNDLSDKDRQQYEKIISNINIFSNPVASDLITKQLSVLVNNTLEYDIEDITFNPEDIEGIQEYTSTVKELEQKLDPLEQDQDIIHKCNSTNNYLSHALTEKNQIEPERTLPKDPFERNKVTLDHLNENEAKYMRQQIADTIKDTGIIDNINHITKLSPIVEQVKKISNPDVTIDKKSFEQVLKTEKNKKEKKPKEQKKPFKFTDKKPILDKRTAVLSATRDKLYSDADLKNTTDNKTLLDQDKIKTKVIAQCNNFNEYINNAGNTTQEESTKDQSCIKMLNTIKKTLNDQNIKLIKEKIAEMPNKGSKISSFKKVMNYAEKKQAVNMSDQDLVNLYQIFSSLGTANGIQQMPELANKEILEAIKYDDQQLPINKTNIDLLLAKNKEYLNFVYVNHEALGISDKVDVKRLELLCRYANEPQSKVENINSTNVMRGLEHAPDIFQEVTELLKKENLTEPEELQERIKNTKKPLSISYDIYPEKGKNIIPLFDPESKKIKVNKKFKNIAEQELELITNIGEKMINFVVNSDAQRTTETINQGHHKSNEQSKGITR